MPVLKICVLFIFFLTSSVFCEEYIPYLGFGHRIGWNNKYKISHSGKISIGFCTLSNLRFYSVELGVNKYPMTDKRSFFTRLQGGILSTSILGFFPFCSGGGAGIVVFYDKNKIIQYCPDVKVFAGSLLFSHLDLSLQKWDIVSDLGCEVYAPLLFNYKAVIPSGLQ